MMSRKDYQRAAQIVRESAFAPQEKFLVASTFAQFFAGDNPRFDHRRFYDAAGVGSMPEATVEVDR